MGSKKTDTTGLMPHAWVNNAVEVMKETKRCDAGGLARRLKLTPGQIAGLMDELETRQIIGPPNGDGARDIIMDLTNWVPLEVEGKEAKEEKNRLRQQEMSGDGFKADRIEEIDDAAEEYQEAKLARMEKSEVETKAKDKLTALLKQHGLTEYNFTNAEDLKFHVYMKVVKETVKVEVEGGEADEQQE